MSLFSHITTEPDQCFFVDVPWHFNNIGTDLLSHDNVFHDDLAVSSEQFDGISGLDQPLWSESFGSNSSDLP